MRVYAKTVYTKPKACARISNCKIVAKKYFFYLHPNKYFFTLRQLF
ncbi:MAG: hypothetical protein JWP45_681 [Mucilaginibacter sp.]|jgi:hypothetical protein|nr:hypothetical protein [Mucilaginibacter sp.]MDB5141034.1 hypothetical protein [Mucilaginibacter sp.]